MYRPWSVLLHQWNAQQFRNELFFGGGEGANAEQFGRMRTERFLSRTERSKWRWSCNMNYSCLLRLFTYIFCVLFTNYTFPYFQRFLAWYTTYKNNRFILRDSVSAIYTDKSRVFPTKEEVARYVSPITHFKYDR